MGPDSSKSSVRPGRPPDVAAGAGGQRPPPCQAAQQKSAKDPLTVNKATVLLNAKGLTKMERSSREIRNTHRKKEGAPAGDKCHRKEPREPSGRPGRALAERRAGEVRRAAGGGSGAGRGRGRAGRRRGDAAKRPEEESRGQRRSARRAAPPAFLLSPAPSWSRINVAPLPAGPGPAPPGPSGLSPLSCKS
ncbi:hypothetical protein Celaphus_00012452 [Cervus elaphus hippelaphus]|uniref:Uncharacterized protein n=1 Tax=Cervus elaphus hippelaphus TaxID=46360 RepID=A0A212CKE8_CEREH|nr:hypothetical protein Celaphus_00012452 [Cervus elaphus hippelaphus]